MNTPYVVGVCLHKKPNIKNKGIKKNYFSLFFLIPKTNKQKEINTKIVA